MKPVEFWNNVKDYNKEIVSVFVEEKNNKLIEMLNEIKDKDKKIIADFGCGIGNSFKYINKFKKIYAIDFSKNMLEFASNNKYKKENFNLIHSEISNIELDEKVDVSLSIMSLFPNNFQEFEKTIINFKKNTKKGGEIILVISSLESRLFSFQIKSDYLFNQGVNFREIQTDVLNEFKESNFTPFGYLKTNSNNIQKHWLKEEIIFNLNKLNLNEVEVTKLELDWKTQIKFKELKNYPKLWYWIVKIKVK